MGCSNSASLLQSLSYSFQSIKSCWVAAVLVYVVLYRLSTVASDICLSIWLVTSSTFLSDIWWCSVFHTAKRATQSFSHHFMWIFFIVLFFLLAAPVQEKALATHSGTLAWKIPWTEEPGRLRFMGSLRVRRNWATSFHFSLSCIGERNGNPLQCSCLENPRDGGAWWAAVYGVTQSRTRLTWLSSSNSSTSL